MTLDYEYLAYSGRHMPAVFTHDGDIVAATAALLQMFRHSTTPVVSIAGRPLTPAQRAALCTPAPLAPVPVAVRCPCGFAGVVGVVDSIPYCPTCGQPQH